MTYRDIDKDKIIEQLHIEIDKLTHEKAALTMVSSEKDTKRRRMLFRFFTPVGLATVFIGITAAVYTGLHSVWSDEAGCILVALTISCSTIFGFFYARFE